MTNLMEEAINALRHVPHEQQEAIARAVMLLAGKDQPVHVLSADEESELAESEAAASRGEFATDEQVRAIWAKHGL